MKGKKVNINSVEWRLKTVDQVFDFYPTASYPRDKQCESVATIDDIKYIHYGDIHTKYNILLDVSNSQIPIIPKELQNGFELIKDGDLIIADTSEDYEGVGKCVEVLNVKDTHAISGLHTLMLRQKEDDFVDGFKGYYFASEQIRNKLLRIVTGIKVYSITKTSLSKVQLAIPSKNEQTAIANILSKVDEAIAAVESSIAAAERLKKSLMQNLLTGKMKPDGTFRTPDEFYTDPKFGKVPVGWEIKKLKEVCINNGEYGANASAIPYNGVSPRYIRITDIDDYGQLLEDDKATIDLKDYSKYLLQDGDFLFARTGDTVGKSLLYKKEQMGLAVYAGYLIKYSFDKEKLIPEYFNLVAKSVFFEQFKVAMKRVGAKPNINSREYASFKFLLPKDTKEQQQTLSQFDNIDDIVKRNTNKVRILERLKKALMQNLLTGKVRINN